MPKHKKEWDNDEHLEALERRRIKNLTKYKNLLMKEWEQSNPVVHARWIVNKDYGDCTCNACGTVYEDNGETIPDYWNYCPHCGAKMDKEE